MGAVLFVGDCEEWDLRAAENVALKGCGGGPGVGAVVRGGVLLVLRPLEAVDGSQGGKHFGGVY